MKTAIKCPTCGHNMLPPKAVAKGLALVAKGATVYRAAQIVGISRQALAAARDRANSPERRGK